jgi:hypothetical protein
MGREEPATAHAEKADPPAEHEAVGYLNAAWLGPVDATSFTSWIKRHPDGGFPIKVRSRGPCPRCHHIGASEDWLWELQGFVAVIEDPGVVADIEEELQARFDNGERPPDVHTNRMVCSCGHRHAEDKVGCGARWDLLVAPR